MEIRKQGMVKFFKRGKGFGFIECDDNSRDVFIHVGELRHSGIKVALDRGVRLEFSVKASEKGPKAIDIKMI